MHIRPSVHYMNIQTNPFLVTRDSWRRMRAAHSLFFLTLFHIIHAALFLACTSFFCDPSHHYLVTIIKPYGTEKHGNKDATCLRTARLWMRRTSSINERRNHHHQKFHHPAIKTGAKLAAITDQGTWQVWECRNTGFCLLRGGWIVLVRRFTSLGNIDMCIQHLAAPAHCWVSRTTLSMPSCLLPRA